MDCSGSHDLRLDVTRGLEVRENYHTDLTPDPFSAQPSPSPYKNHRPSPSSSSSPNISVLLDQNMIPRFDDSHIIGSEFYNRLLNSFVNGLKLGRDEIKITCYDVEDKIGSHTTKLSFHGHDRAGKGLLYLNNVNVNSEYILSYFIKNILEKYGYPYFVTVCSWQDVNLANPKVSGSPLHIRKLLHIKLI